MKTYTVAYSHYLPTCILTRILTCLLNYSLTHSPTHLIKYIHTRIKFNIAVYQDITILSPFIIINIKYYDKTEILLKLL